MIIHGQGRRDPADSAVRARLQKAALGRHRNLFLLALLLGVFMSGVVAQRYGLLGALREGIGIGDVQTARLSHVVLDPLEHFRASVTAPDLSPDFRVQMSASDFERVRSRREEMLDRGLMFTSDDDYVPATVRVGDSRSEVRMRLKGNLVDHIQTDKWSYRIQVRDGTAIHGMRRFSIQHPGTRNYLSEWGWLETLRMEGLIAPRYFFTPVVFNERRMGIFAVEEHFSHELLEFHGRRSGVIFALDEDHYFLRRDRLDREPWRYDRVQLGGFRNTLVEPRRSSTVAEDEKLSEQRDAGIGLLRAFQEGRLPAGEVFDVPLLGRFLAVSELWEARHALIWNNPQFYFNPTTGRIEPVGFDGQAQEFIDVALASLISPWTVEALQDIAVARAYVSELDRVSRPEYLETLRAALDEDHARWRHALLLEFPEVRDQDIWRGLAQKQEYIRRLLDPTRTVLAMATSRGERSATSQVRWVGSEGTTVELRSIIGLPVEVLEFRIGDLTVPAATVWTGSAGQPCPDADDTCVLLPPSSYDAPYAREEGVFHFPLDLLTRGGRGVDLEAEPVRLAVVTRILGMDNRLTTPVEAYASPALAGAAPSAPTIDMVLRQHPFLVRSGEAGDELDVRPGRWEVSGDLVLPPGVRLRAGPGTELLFEPDAILLARGPLDFRGGPDDPVRLAPLDGQWAGVVVLNAGERSRWTDVVVEDTQGVERNGWMLTGGVTFHESPLFLHRSRVVRSSAANALSVLRTSFELRDCEFAGGTLNAFDASFAEGAIENCLFSDFGRNAIDVTGSDITVRGVRIQDVGGSGIAATDRSRVGVEDLRVRRAGIAVTTTNLSDVRVQGAVLEDLHHVGFVAHVTKLEFGPPALEATNVSFSQVSSEGVVEEGSRLRLNGRVVEASGFELRALRDTEVLRR